jgi:hypothetical protein
MLLLLTRYCFLILYLSLYNYFLTFLFFTDTEVTNAKPQTTGLTPFRTLNPPRQVTLPRNSGTARALDHRVATVVHLLGLMDTKEVLLPVHMAMKVSRHRLSHTGIHLKRVIRLNSLMGSRHRREDTRLKVGMKVKVVIHHNSKGDTRRKEGMGDSTEKLTLNNHFSFVLHVNYIRFSISWLKCLRQMI